jgi:hypothetical protein
MRPTLRDNIAVPMTAVLAFTLMVPVRAQEPTAEEEPNTYRTYSGGIARAKRAITETRAWNVNTRRAWVTLPLSSISYNVPAGTSYLFNVAFSAECAKIGGDYLRIRILDNGVPVQPYDGFQVFCSASTYATHKGNWVKQVQPGYHNLVVQFYQTFGTASIDDWTFEVVVHD